MKSGTALTVTTPTNGQLPASYETARQAIAECDRIDECKTWSDKAAALASYARQAKDDSLRVMALRIQARAERRCGQLLKQIPRADESTRFGKVAPVPAVTRTQAATEAGLSERQRKTALRIASIPSDEFDAAVESPSPPSLTTLAERGNKPRSTRPTPPNAAAPSIRSQAKDAFHVVARFAAWCKQQENPEHLGSAFGFDDVEVVLEHAGIIDAWLGRFVSSLPDA